MTAAESSREARLAEEILEAQKTRATLLQWKLLLVAALGAAAFGLTPGGGGRFMLLLSLIPPVAAYVDLLCSNLNLRMLLIGRFQAEQQHDPYETFVHPRRMAFVLEDWALYGSSYLLSALVLLAGGVLLLAQLPGNLRTWLIGLSLVVSGAGGLILTRWVEEAYRILASLPNLCGDMDAVRVFRHQLGLRLPLFGAVSRQVQRFKTWRQPKPQAQNPQVLEWLRPVYREQELAALYQFLQGQGTFEFKPLANGLFPAVGGEPPGSASGYQHVWVRDNVHIAHAHFCWGDVAAATRNASTLMEYFQGQHHRLEQIIARPELAAQPMQRPQVRFDGATLKALEQPWPHAQNDALGYFLWFWCKLARQGLLELDGGTLTLLAQLSRYLEAIGYWQDADSGHWEEAPKINASSIGAVVAGLQQLAALAREQGLWTRREWTAGGLSEAGLEALIHRGRQALQQILPYEFRQGGAQQLRRYDSALLFLVYPLEVVEDAQAEVILKDVVAHLEGSWGIRRYPGDSYWCADYKTLYPPEARSNDFSQNQAERDAHLRPGQEAQWCLFDPLLSVIHGRRYRQLGGERQALQAQIRHFHRALGQLTRATSRVPAWRCPEAYYLEQGRHVPNDQVPLQWTQAYLRLAFGQLLRNCRW
jgi:phosphorylase kinase alpha/beta subunit